MKDIKEIKKSWAALKKAHEGGYKVTGYGCGGFRFFADSRRGTVQVNNEDLNKFFASDVVRDFIESNRCTVETYQHKIYTYCSIVRFSF